jgi:hypothetical protein
VGAASDLVQGTLDLLLLKIVALGPLCLRDRQRSVPVWIAAVRTSNAGRFVDFGALIFPILDGRWGTAAQAPQPGRPGHWEAFR